MGLDGVTHQIVQDATENPLSSWSLEVLQEDLLITQHVLEDLTCYCFGVLHDLEVENIGDGCEGNKDSLKNIRVGFFNDFRGSLVE